MNENETTALVRAFDRAYINGKFVTPHGTQVVDLVNPTNNTVTRITFAMCVFSAQFGRPNQRSVILAPYSHVLEIRLR